ncbi:pro-neuregulin-4, membrane-bound isoform-like [Branchiostoma floridae]|uniref:Pro-neuregulin-4, membrane-bound isoform-like n=1 Tax=Branchiostoma floridae TaxID=7739 RepID=A0A9J7L7V9_BRAFL|nr:pro-neuregulin-4, membrane-bound isoform-like [Branchiostoma floridae]
MVTTTVPEKHLRLMILTLCLVPAFSQDGIFYDDCPESYSGYCLNGGTCTILPGLPEDQAIRCSCPSDKVGERCENSNPNSQTTARGPEGEIRAVYIVVGVLGGLLLIATVATVVYFCRRNKHEGECEGEQKLNGGEMSSTSKVITTIV